MRRITRIVSFLIITLVVSSSAIASERKISDSKAKLIRELLEVTDAKEGTADAIIDILGGRLGLPLPSEEVREEFRENPRSTEITEETQLELYDRYFTEPQLRDLITFFKTETGEHYVEVARKISAEARKNLRAAASRYMTDAAERTRANRTRNDFRGLGLALKAYFAEHGSYSKAKNADELAGLLSPKYTPAVPNRDAWGHSIQYQVSADCQHYRLMSAGTDGKFAAEQEKGDDIFYGDGRFIHGGDPSYPQ